MHTIRSTIRLAIRGLGRDLPPRSHSVCQLFEHFDGAVPIHTRVSDTDTRLQRRQPTSIGCWRLLVAFVDIRLNHDTNDAVFASAQLVANDLCDFRLILVILL